MIFVTVGNYLGFPRLLSAVDRLKAEGLIADEVLLQIGGTENFQSTHCEVVRFLDPSEFEQQMHQASAVISHAGAGTIIHALRMGKTPVVMPRRVKYHEHVDDHQLEVAEALATEGRIILAREPDELIGALEKVKRMTLQAPPAPAHRMIDLVSRAIDDFIGPELEMKNA